MASTTLRDYLQHTEDAISAGHIDDALAQCQRILSHFPESLEAQRLLGEVYLAQGHLEDAQQTFDWILINDPENIIVYCDRALICERLSDLDTALDCYQQAYELSRGDGQIRQEFNKLSSRSGQQGFMFSRAGLARLYMRGDLLPQAIQEWEVVLSANPERLDARAGLLEAYWREGLYEQVEELATALLNDVPGCLKALLLLAHVSSLKNIQQAQELLQRAEVLDPELVMAQELFSDLIASQPHDPFLQLLKKGPVVLSEQTAPHITAMTAPTPMESSPTHTNSSQSASTFSDSLLSSWSNLDTFISTRPQSEPEPDIPTFAWSSNSAMDINPWSTIDQLASNNNAPAADPQSEVEHDADVPVAEAQEEESTDLQSWKQAEQFAEPEAETFDSWSSMSNIGTEASDSPWGTETREETGLTTPPAWLDMLTKGERRPASQPLGDISTPAASSPAPLDEAEPTVVVPPTPSPVEPAVAEYMPWKDSPQVPTLEDEDKESDEPSFFGPEWLKSLGAAVIEEQTSSTPVKPPMPAVPEEKKPEESAIPAAMAPSSDIDFWQEPVAELWTNQLAEANPQQQTPIDPWQDQAATYGAEANADWQVPIDPWLEQLGQPQSHEFHESHGLQPSFQSQHTPIDPWMDAAATPAPAQEAGIETPQPQHATEETLETLERELYAQGFVPLEPGSLATIAEEEALSSALSQLSSFESHEPMPINQIQPAQSIEAVQSVQPVQPTQVEQPLVPLSEPAEGPLWLPAPASSASRPVAGPAPVPVTRVEKQPELQPQREQPEAVADFSASPEPMTITDQRIPIVPKAPAAPGMTMPSVGNDILLDSELEMTMRRPVVRLQPVTKSTVSQGYAAPASRGRTSAIGKAGDSNLSHKERLLKGYHYQLAGDYDEAMQEYRIIIRNAPEFLGEVISNMRALLKLAPKFAPGYRVLGDAYMRQGEYLQAMEAYNKALTMAKKGHGTR